MSDKPIRIKRSKHDAQNRYFLMLRSTAQDDTLTWEALGVLTYLLSKPDDWVVQVNDLRRKRAGRDKVYNIVNELKQAHYIRFDLTRDDKGKVISGEYFVYEEPFTEIQEVDTPITETPDTVLPDTVNTHLTEYREEKNTDITAQSAERQTRKPNPLFDAVCIYIFEVDAATVTNEGGRIGPIAAWLGGKSDGMKRNGGKVGFISRPAEPEHVKRFAGWYKSTHPNISIPLDFVKFVEMWRKWATVASKPKESRKPAPITDFSEPTAEERAALEAARKSIRPTWERVSEEEEAAS